MPCVRGVKEFTAAVNYIAVFSKNMLFKATFYFMEKTSIDLKFCFNKNCLSSKQESAYDNFYAFRTSEVFV